MNPLSTSTSAYRIAILISGGGSNLQALIDAQIAGSLGAEIALVVSDRGDAYGLQRALNHSIAAAFVPLRKPRDANERANWEQRLASIVAAFTPDLVVLSGFMRVLSPAFLDWFPNRVINQHPALLPDDGGATYTTSTGITIPALRGAHVVPDALRHSLPITGCTIHRVTPVVDDGPVLARAEVPVLPDDTEVTLHERIKTEEQRLIVEVVARLARARS